MADAPHVVIRKIRHSLHMTQAQLARRAGLPQSHLAKIETGKVDIQLSTLAKLLKAMYCEAVLAPEFLKTPEEAVNDRIKEVASQKKLSREEKALMKRFPTSAIWEDAPSRTHWPVRIIAKEDPLDDLRFWLAKPVQDRIAAVEFLRRQYHLVTGAKEMPRIVRSVRFRRHGE